MSAILKDIRAAFGDVEAVPYTVVVQRGGYEERLYPARRWACTAMSGPSRHDLVTPMFRRLFCYISGRNEPNVRIDMTTPVATLVEPCKTNSNNKDQDQEEEEKQRKIMTTSLEEDADGDLGRMTTNPITNGNTSPSSSSSSSSLPTYTMGFVVPASHQQEPPASSDKNIFIEDRPKLVVLARRFSGYMNDEVVQREMKALQDAIKCNGEEDGVDFSKYYVAGYDPPFKLLGRRNEVWVTKALTERHQNGCSNGDEAVEDVMVDGMVLVSGVDGDDDEVIMP